MKNYLFILLVFIGVGISLFFPEYFTHVGDFKLTLLIVPILQVIMFGMGSQMSFHDFVGVIKMPKKVLIGIACQYILMPIIAFGLALTFGFPPEVSAGIILVGTSPGGLASNVMTFLAKGNLALSVTLTACSTLLAPILTPQIMALLGGEFVPIDVPKMMMNILTMVILPIVLGLVTHHLFQNFVKRITAALTLLSQIGIIAIIVVITASGSANLMQIGALLIVACLIHNVLGYTAGYGLARLLKLPEQDARTIAIEVGMQNAGMASGLAVLMGKVGSIGLAPAIFGPMQNISGAMLAGSWSKRVPKTPPTP